MAAGKLGKIDAEIGIHLCEVYLDKVIGRLSEKY